MKSPQFGFAAVASALALAQAPVRAEAPVVFGPAANAAAEAIVAKGISGLTVSYASVRGPTVRADVGSITFDTQYPIASASKCLTAAVVMTLVDEGKVSLDKPISTWLPQIKGESGKITLRHLLSQTSGIAGGLGDLYELKQDHRVTLAQSAAEVLARPPIAKPGTDFRYGAPGFQVAGAVVEAVTGQRWEEAFQARIGRPLGMKDTYWTYMKFGAASPPPAETNNPTLQGGAVSTADDYMRFLKMLAQKGSLDGRQVLSAAAVAEMLSDQTAHATMHPTGASLLVGAHYSLGNWCEAWDAAHHCTRSSSIGAFGACPWLDSTSGRYGFLFMYQPKDAFAVWPEMMALQVALTEGK